MMHFFGFRRGKSCGTIYTKQGRRLGEHGAINTRNRIAAPSSLANPKRKWLPGYWLLVPGMFDFAVFAGRVRGVIASSQSCISSESDSAIRSKRRNSIRFSMQMSVCAVIIIGGMRLFDASNMVPFAPMGVTGILRGSSAAFFGYLGYDEAGHFSLGL